MNPPLRFSTSEDWTECQLKDICEINPSVEKIPDTFQYIDLESVTNGRLLQTIPCCKSSAPSRAKRILSNEDVLFQTVRPYQKNNYFFKSDSNTSVVASTGYAQLRCTSNSAYFLYTLIHTDSFVTQVLQKCTGGAYPAITASSLSTVKINIPVVQEQQKIASFFSTLDQKIELNERKLEALEKLKKGLLRKIFDHEIRFKSDDGGTYSNWNESSLGNYFSVKMCKRIFKEETSDIGEVPFFKIGTFGKTPDAYISKELFEKYRKNFNYPSINDTLISCSGTVGRCVLFDGKASYFQDSNIVWLEPIDKHLIYNKIYLYIVLSNLSWHELSSTTIKRIYSKDLLSKKWPIPCIEEQNKIASLFILLDKKITLFSQRLQSLKKLKKGFMQQMFV